MSDSSSSIIHEWIYQLERIAPTVHAKQHMAVVQVIAFLHLIETATVPLSEAGGSVPSAAP